jgi:CYTH domain-containing protein
MNEQISVPQERPIREGKYSRIEREKRFLLAGPPAAAGDADRRRIIDRYLPGTRLRLRCVEHQDTGVREFKLTQKVASGQSGYVQGLITNTYLTLAEYDLLATLPGDVLTKTRLSVPPLSIDIFDPPLHGLVTGEVEFATDDAAESFTLPREVVAEVTEDSRFTGGSLVKASHDDLLSWLADYGIKLTGNSASAVDPYDLLE